MTDEQRALYEAGMSALRALKEAWEAAAGAKRAAREAEARYLAARKAYADAGGNPAHITEQRPPEY